MEDFYRNKQVRFITAYSAGGLFDTATRIFGRHIGKFIPGKPNVWVDNMTGAGGLIATNYLANNAPRDGSVLLNLDGALLRLQALGNPAAKFDARRFNWLPSPGPDIQVCWVGKQSTWQSITEAFSGSKELKMGGLAPGTFPSDNARALQAALGINLKIIDGFKGVTEIRLATESGEVDGSCSSYEGVVRSFPKGAQGRRYQSHRADRGEAVAGFGERAQRYRFGEERAEQMAAQSRGDWSQRHQPAVHPSCRRSR